jgi:hypothetical protein
MLHHPRPIAISALVPTLSRTPTPWPSGIRLRDLHCTDHLLLVVLWVVAAVVRADERPVVEGTVEDIAEIVTDEGVGRNGRRSAVGSVELRIPRVAAQPDVVSDRI